MRHYRSDDEDSARWRRVVLRPGDIVVSTRSRHGTTWVQAILLMLVHGPELPAPLPVLSPWVDHLVEPVEEVVSRIEAQDHRRILKTHTPLDGVPVVDGVHYVVVGRHPLDAAVSLYHQGDNIDRQRLAALTGTQAAESTQRPDLATWLADWVRAERDPVTSLDSLLGVLWHLADAWQRRTRHDVTLVHYADLLADLPGQVHRLASATDLPLPEDLDRLVAAVHLDAMRDRATTFVPDALGVLADPGAFFRRGGTGTGAAILSPADLALYRRRVADHVDPDLDAWLHH